MLKFSIRLIAVISFALAAFGAMVISYASKSQGQGPYHYLIMQSVFLLGGLIGAFILYHVDYHFYKKPVVLWMLVIGMVLSLLLVLVPGVGKAVKGAHRWIALGPVNVQPVEFVKLMMVLFLAGYLELQEGRIRRFKQGVLLPGIVIGAVLACLIAQPDFGGSMVVCALAGATLLMGGIGWKRCMLFGALGVLAIGVFLACNPNRVARLKNEQNGENYQAEQSETAFRNGRVLGAGLGVGLQREKYLPECHTDFIFAIIGEDLGLVATASITGAFLLILLGGTVIACHARDKQGMLLAFGATLLICAQGTANMAVVTHILPTKGLALPFLSYGGSCLLSSFAAVGVLLGVGRVTIEAESASEQAVQKIVSFD